MTEDTTHCRSCGGLLLQEEVDEGRLVCLDCRLDAEGDDSR